MTTRLTDAEIRAVLLQNGFSFKEGYGDLKPYVYAAARALIAAHEEKRAEYPLGYLYGRTERNGITYWSFQWVPGQEPKMRRPSGVSGCGCSLPVYAKYVEP